MKKIMKQLLTFLIAVMALNSAFAQQGLHIMDALNGSYSNDNNSIETIVTGKQLKDYKLSLYHSLSVTDKQAISHLRDLIAKDSKSAINKEVGLKNGIINYGFFEFTPLDKKANRFLFFYSNDTKAVVIYMEGKTTIENIKSIIKK